VRLLRSGSSWHHLGVVLCVYPDAFSGAKDTQESYRDSGVFVSAGVANACHMGNYDLESVGALWSSTSTPMAMIR
jgi:hypothetical protein